MAEQVDSGSGGDGEASIQPPRRYPAGLYSHGAEPDPRFSLANERTFLAWIRTSLALIAAGVALEAFVVNMPPGLRLAAALLLIVAGSGGTPDLGHSAIRSFGAS